MSSGRTAICTSSPAEMCASPYARPGTWHLPAVETDVLKPPAAIVSVTVPVNSSVLPMKSRVNFVDGC